MLHLLLSPKLLKDNQDNQSDEIILFKAKKNTLAVFETVTPKNSWYTYAEINY